VSSGGHVIDNVRAHYASCDIGSVLRNTEFLKYDLVRDGARLAENWLRVLNILTTQNLRARLHSQGMRSDRPYPGVTMARNGMRVPRLFWDPLPIISPPPLTLIIGSRSPMLYRNECELSGGLATTADSAVPLRERLANQERPARP